ncbi:MAG: transcription termination factor Rho [Atopobiaceae bacterium]
MVEASTDVASIPQETTKNEAADETSKPRKRQTRTRKKVSEDATEGLAPAPKRTRRRKADEGGTQAQLSLPDDAAAEPAEEKKPRKRATKTVRSTRTSDGDVSQDDAATSAESDARPVRTRASRTRAVAQSEAEPAEKPRRRTRRASAAAKTEDASAHDGDSATSVSHEAQPQEVREAQHEVPAAQVTAAPAASVAPAAESSHAGAVDSSQAGSADKELGAQDSSRPAQAQAQAQDGEDAQGEGTHRRRHVREHKTRPARTAQNAQQPNRRRNNRRSPERVSEPSLTTDALEEMKVAELRSKAADLEIDYVGMRKAELVQAIFEASALAEGFRPVEGVLDIQAEGYGFLRTGNYMQGEHDAFVHQQLIRQFRLRTGDKIKGTVTPSRSNNKFPPLGRIETINGVDPEEARKRPRFRDLTPIYPHERLVMEHGMNSITGRAIDLVAPIGKGQRGLIVSPPKAGKTTVLKNICQSIAANNPEVHLFCLLVDERPEEVTDMQRSIKGEVIASTFDMPASNHTAVAELVIEHAKRLVEMGEDVVVVLDSITRLARAYNLAAPASGRILSGGVDSAALYPPKKFLGAARNIENGGSLTILASALVDTGSKMDEVIFEEFKGTGNMELKLDRELADKRIFPAIDPVASGTRNEDLLIDAQFTPFIWGLRRILANMNNTERAATALVKGLKATRDNEEFLIRSAKKAQQQEYV